MNYQKIMKDCLPFEFLEYVFQDYEKRYKKATDPVIQERYFEAFKTFFQLYSIIHNRMLLAQWKKLNFECTRTDIQFQVQQLKNKTNQKLMEHQETFVFIQNKVQHPKKAQHPIADYERYLSWLARRS